MSPTICHRLLVAAFRPDLVEEMAADDELVLICEEVLHEHGLRRDIIARSEETE